MKPYDPFWLTPESARHVNPNPAIGEDEVVELASGAVLDYGCGVGRLARRFDPKGYLGVDVSPERIQAARAAHPDHTFEVISGIDWIGGVKVFCSIIFDNVLLHLDDDQAREALGLTTSNPSIRRIVIAEHMDWRFRRTNADPKCWNRSLDDYSEMLGEPAETRSVPNPAYGGAPLTVAAWE